MKKTSRTRRQRKTLFRDTRCTQLQRIHHVVVLLHCGGTRARPVFSKTSETRRNNGGCVGAGEPRCSGIFARAGGHPVRTRTRSRKTPGAPAVLSLYPTRPSLPALSLSPAFLPVSVFVFPAPLIRRVVVVFVRRQSPRRSVGMRVGRMHGKSRWARSRTAGAPHREAARGHRAPGRLRAVHVPVARLSQACAPVQRPVQAAHSHAGAFRRQAKQVHGNGRNRNFYVYINLCIIL